MDVLCKKIFSGAAVKCFFLYDSNNSDTVVFENVGFRENQKSTFENDTFSRVFSAMDVFGMCLPYVKRCFEPFFL